MNKEKVGGTITHGIMQNIKVNSILVIFRRMNSIPNIIEPLLSV